MTAVNYPGTVAAGAKSTTAMAASGSAGFVDFTCVPSFAGTQGAGAAGVQYLCDFSNTVARNNAIVWRGDVDPGYFALRIGAVEVARFYSLHAASASIRIKATWSTTLGFAELAVNGCAARKYAVAPTLPFVDPPQTTVTLGSDIFGAAAFSGTFSNVTFGDYYNGPHRKVAIVGDSITQEPSILADLNYRKSWSRYIAAGLGHDRGLVWNAGVNSDAFADILARLTADVVNQLPDICAIHAGVNDLVADRTLVQMQTDFTALVTALLAAGIEVYAYTILPFGESASYTVGREAIRAAFNAWLLAGVTGVSRVYDASAEMLWPSHSPPSIYDAGASAWAYFDSLHLNQDGLQHLGESAWTDFHATDEADEADNGVEATSTHNPTITAVAT